MNTPETDGEWNRLACQDHPEFERNLADFARKLERERDEARVQLRKAQIENDHNWQAMNLYEAERVLADRLAALLQRDRYGHGGQVVDPECDCCDCKWLKPIDEVLAAWKEARSESALP